MKTPSLILYISMSLDGYIATEEDDLSWLSIVEQKGEDYGYQDFIDTVGTYIVGRRTYDKVLELTGGSFPAAKQHTCYVITRQQRSTENGVTFYNGHISDLVRTIKATSDKHIYCDGGGQIVKLLMDHDLIDQYIISVIPIILGAGKRLFMGNTPTRKLKALGSTQYDTGLVQLSYEVVRK